MEASPTAERGSGARFFPVHIDSVEDDVLAMDLFIRYENAELALYRSRGIDFASSDRERLLEQGIEFLYVPMSQHGEYRNAFSRRLETSFKAPGKSKAERGRMVRASCCRMVEDAMLFPGNPGAMNAIEEVGKLFARLAREDEENFSYVLDMSEHDYYTITHMVNVGVGCGLLAKELRPKDDDLIATIIQGGLVHDLGKRGVATEILNKEGKLSDDDWTLVRKHPGLGHDELCLHENVPQIVLEMTRDHHERLDGRGYPNAISGADISFATRICTVVDVYDAITAARPYRGPIPPPEALRMMAEGVGTQFDEVIFSAWRTLVERLTCTDPERAPKAAPVSQRSLAALMPRPASTKGEIVQESVGMMPASSEAELPVRRDNDPNCDRRLFARSKCYLAVMATFERQMKDCGVPIGQPFEARVGDLSRGGLQIQTPWPLSQNDLLTLEFRRDDGAVRRRVRVVRIRRNKAGQWIAGACFVSEELRKSA